jgi:hypothetical protein
MNIPFTAGIFILVTLGRAILGGLHVQRIKQASKGVFIDPTVEITLRYAAWYSVYPVGCFGLGVLFAAFAINEATFDATAGIYLSLGSIMLFGAIFLFWMQSRARVWVAGKMMVYSEGSDRHEILSDEVSEVTIDVSKFVVRKRSGQIVLIPTEFVSSEIVYAFLEHSAEKNRVEPNQMPQPTRTSGPRG